MGKEIKKLYMNDMSQQSMYKIFGLRQVKTLPDLTDWLNNLGELNNVERIIATHYQKRLSDNYLEKT